MCQCLFNCFLHPFSFLQLPGWVSMLTNVFCEESDACATCFDVAQRSGARGTRVTLIPSTRGRIRPLTLISLLQKKPCNFPLQCHHAGSIGLKTPSFLLLSTHAWPEVWMRSVRDAAPYCTKEMQSEGGGTEKKQFWHIFFFSVTVRQFSTAGQQFPEGIRARRDTVCWWSTFWHLCWDPPVYMNVEPSML